MKRLAILNGDSKVINIGVFHNSFPVDGVKHVNATLAVQVGDTWNGGQFIPGPAEAPLSEDPVWLALRVLANMVSPEAAAAVDAQLRRPEQERGRP